MRILIVKLLITLGVIKIDELSRKFRNKIVKRRKYTRRNLGNQTVKDCTIQEASDPLSDAISAYRCISSDSNYAVPHHGYPNTRAANRFYHHGCWVKMCGRDKMPTVLHFDTQRDAAEFIASETGLAVTRSDIYNALRWSCGKLHRKDNLIAVISYDRP